MSAHPDYKPFNFLKWLDEHKHEMKPPVSNKLLHDNAGMVIQALAGGNTRADFHDDPVEEWFHQINGDMILKVWDRGKIYDVRINEGDIFFLPSHVRHSPQRPDPNSYGIVVEGPRQLGMRDGFEWFCFDCETLLHRAEVSLTSSEGIVSELPKVFEEYHENIEARTCENCGVLHPGKGKPPDGWVVL